MIKWFVRIECGRFLQSFALERVRIQRTLALWGDEKTGIVSIRAHEGGQMAHILAAMMPAFQPTPSARRATLCGAILGVDFLISIHALCEEDDFDL